MKYPRALLILLLVCAWSQTVRAQAADSWVNLGLAGGQFTIQMPEKPAARSHSFSFDQLQGDGRIYTATSDGVDYTVWALVNKDSTSNGSPDADAYLDACADLVWESLLKPLRDELPKKPEVVSYMAYQRELVSFGLPGGREYTIMLGNRLGVTHFYVAGSRIYVLAALGAKADLAATLRFINSFGIKGQALPPAAAIQADPKLIPPSPPVLTGTGIGPGSGIGPGRGLDPGGGVGPGRGENPGGGDRDIVGGGPATLADGSTNYSRVFSGREVSKKARVLAKPEPSYTESARKYAVQGTVVLRAIFSSSGEVINIRVVKKLPHGLTQVALAAAKQIKFTAASKDGHAVSMHIQLEYNFNLY